MLVYGGGGYSAPAGSEVEVRSEMRTILACPFVNGTATTVCTTALAWGAQPGMPVFTLAAGAAVLYDRYMLIHGGSNLELTTITSDTWAYDTVRKVLWQLPFPLKPWHINTVLRPVFIPVGPLTLVRVVENSGNTYALLMNVEYGGPFFLLRWYMLVV